MTVIPTEDAWESRNTFTIPAGMTLHQAFDALKSQGFRWAFNDGKVFLLK